MYNICLPILMTVATVFFTTGATQPIAGSSDSGRGQPLIHGVLVQPPLTPIEIESVERSYKNPPPLLDNARLKQGAFSGIVGTAGRYPSPRFAVPILPTIRTPPLAAWAGRNGDSFPAEAPRFDPPATASQYIGRLKAKAFSLFRRPDRSPMIQDHILAERSAGAINVADHFRQWKLSQIRATVPALQGADLSLDTTYSLGETTEATPTTSTGFLAGSVDKVGNATLIIASVLPISLMGAAGLTTLIRGRMHRGKMDGTSSIQASSFFANRGLDADSDTDDLVDDESDDGDLNSKFEVGHDSAMWAHQADFSAF